MKKDLLISATLDQPDFLENLVEKLADRRYDAGYSYAVVPDSLKAVESSSTDTFISGTVRILDNEDPVNMPFITRFLFTCVKERNGNYKLEWSSSLS